MGNNSGFTYDPFKYAEYAESDAVKDANKASQDAAKALTDYGSKFTYVNQEALDDALKNYLSRGEFSYDFNADALYQQYKDKYIQQGKMAMADTIGQASAMTGGYGNSYAATAGNQAYQASLQNLNDIIPELYQMAYDRYNQQGQDMLNQYSLLSTDRDAQYGLWSDGYNRLASDRDYYQGLYDNERTFDYGKYSDDRTLAHSEHTNEQAYAYNNYRDSIEDARYEESKKVTSGGGSIIVGSGGKDAGVPEEIANKAQTFDNNASLASWLDGLVDTNALTQSEADQLYAMYADVNEKYTTNKDGSSSISYKDMVGSANGWSMVDDGGINWFGGIDNNAVVMSPNGVKIRLDDLVDKLVSEGMEKSKAKTAVKKLQKSLE